MTLLAAVLLVVQTAVGMVVKVTIWVAVRAVKLRSSRVTSILGALLTIGAGFNGASFLDFNHDISSLLMALLALGALSCYLVGLYLQPKPLDALA
jgi:hypothetical protein